MFIEFFLSLCSSIKPFKATETKVLRVREGGGVRRRMLTTVGEEVCTSSSWTRETVSLCYFLRADSVRCTVVRMVYLINLFRSQSSFFDLAGDSQ